MQLTYKESHAVYRFCKSFTLAKRDVQVRLVWSYYDLGKCYIIIKDWRLKQSHISQTIPITESTKFVNMTTMLIT